MINEEVGIFVLFVYGLSLLSHLRSYCSSTCFYQWYFDPGAATMRQDMTHHPITVYRHLADL